ncbi:MAG: sugar-binding protein [Alphaproteobacteria bacterium]
MSLHYRHLLWLVLFGLQAEAYSSDRWPVAAAVCAPATSVIRVDGLANEPAWRQATAITHFTVFGTRTFASPQTIARVCYDQSTLYLHVTCLEPSVDKLVAAVRNRDGTVRFDDSVEVFIDPKHDHVHYFQFVVNSIGTRFDRSGASFGWSGNWTAKGHVGKTAWSVEIAIPFKTLGIERPRPGQVLGLNVCRERYAGKRQLSHWSTVKRSFHDCARFGHLVFADAEQLLPSGKWLAELGAGGRAVEVWTSAGRVRCESLRALLCVGGNVSFARLAQLVEQIEARIEKVQSNDLKKRFAALKTELDRVQERCAGVSLLAPEEYLVLRAKVADLSRRGSELDWDIKFAELFGD